MSTLDHIISAKFSEPLRIIVAPLNWGIGHATRCLPLIRSLIRNGHEVCIASDGDALIYLTAEEPTLDFFYLPGYGIRYSGNSMSLNILIQSPKIIYTINAEHKAIGKIVNKWNADVIISDNRYGCYHQKCKNVFITHQINILSKYHILSLLATKWNEMRIKRFDECWIPDFENGQTLGGKLSHQHKLSSFTYIGPLSRMKGIKSEIRWDILCVLSGPEPQRTKLETQLLKAFNNTNDKRILLVRGLVHPDTPELKSPNINVVNFMTATALNHEVISSRLVISRSGYSSIMDWVTLHQRAILIPTPGQPEQEYLAEFHKGGPLFSALLQKDIHQLFKFID